jgi:hypothetical protein
MSLTVSLSNLYYALKGAEIFVFQPENVLIYRQGTGDQSALIAAVRLGMVNVASAESDVLVAATLQPAPGAPKFQWEGSILPSFTGSPRPLPCEDNDCVASYPNLFLRAVPDEIVDIPTGGTRLRWLTFPLSCAETSSCDGFRDYKSAVQTLNGKKLPMTLTLTFRGDGERRVSCLSPVPLSGEYLNSVGWTSLACEAAKVEGEPFL